MKATVSKAAHLIIKL